jgi:hypothetical protein
MSAGSQPIDNVGSLGIYKEEDTINVNGAPHYLSKSWRGLNLSTHMSFMCKTFPFDLPIFRTRNGNQYFKQEMETFLEHILEKWVSLMKRRSPNRLSVCRIVNFLLRKCYTICNKSYKGLNSFSNGVLIPPVDVWQSSLADKRDYPSLMPQFANLF